MSASALPPSECFSRQVSLESRYGTCTCTAAVGAAAGGRPLAVEPLAWLPLAAPAAAASVSAVMTCAAVHAVHREEGNPFCC